MIAQLCIAFTGVIAVWLSQDPSPERRRFACLFGLLGQPFWFYSSFTAEQWGIFVLCFLYAWSWLRGVRTHWSHLLRERWHAITGSWSFRVYYETGATSLRLTKSEAHRLAKIYGGTVRFDP